MPQITSVPVSTPPASITSQTPPPKIIETSEVSKPVKPTSKSTKPASSPSATSKKLKAENKVQVLNVLTEGSGGKVLEQRPVVLRSKSKSATSTITSQPVRKESKAVFRSPEVQLVKSGTSAMPLLHSPLAETELQPLTVKPTLDVPVIAKPVSAPKDSDCGCGK
jgi:hypothetical protein